MRKTQVALAALALMASTAALAEVKLYGSMDMSIMRDDQGTFMQGAGNNNGTFWGISGSEDLGGGLKAGFNLEGGLSLSTGGINNGGPGAAGGYNGIFNRAANVFIGNEMIEVRMGHQFSTFVGATLTGLAGVTGNGAFVPAIYRVTGGAGGIGVNSALGGGVGGAGSSSGFFYPDLVSATVNLNGVTVTAQTKIGTKDVLQAPIGSYNAYSATTSIAGVNLAAAALNMTDDTGAKGSAYTLGGNTQFAGVTLRGSYGSGSSTLYDGSGFAVGADVPVTDALAIGYTYAKNNYTTADASGALGTQNSIGAKYSLSKSTYGYMTYNSFSEDSTVSGGAGSGSTTVKTVTFVGLVHTF